MLRKLTICLFSASMLLLDGNSPAAPASTQDTATERSTVAQFEACLSTADDAARLACLEKTSRAFIEASRRQDVVVMSREDIRSTRRSLFGFQLPRINLFGRGSAEPEQSEVEAEIGSVSSQGYGKYVIVLKDGARWSSTEAWPGGQTPRAGQMLTIRKGSLGGYFMKIGNGRAVRAIRIG